MHSLSPRQLEVLQILFSGQSVTSAADAAGIHRTTIHHWCRVIPQFRAALNAAKQSRSDAIRDQINELAVPALTLLKRTLEEETASAPLPLRAALAVLKTDMQPEKLPGIKDTAFDTLLDAADARSDDSVSEEIHHNSSLSSEKAGNPSPKEQTPRNASCPCGSKLKFKRCCGRNAPPVLLRAA